jgi:hypothetical protein
VDETGSFWTDPDAIAANAAGRVTPAQYETVVRGTGLQRASGEPTLPGPGWYRFFWLRDRSGAESPAHRLLSAQPVPVSELVRWRPEELAATRERLAVALGAGRAEVSVDRPAAGRLTEGQRRVVRRQLRQRVTRAPWRRSSAWGYWPCWRPSATAWAWPTSTA